jgi:hypothetical protein
MKKIIVLTVVAIASQAVAIFAGEPVVSSKQVIAPPPEFFRPNEFDIGAFGTYATGVGSGEHAGRLHGWGGGMDFTYWFPWKYAGVRFQGAGLSIGSGNGSQTGGVLTGDFILRLPFNIGEDRVLGHFGGGLEYRFTPHIGLFGEAGYDLVNGPRTTSSRLEAMIGIIFSTFCSHSRPSFLGIRRSGRSGSGESLS